MGEAMSLNRRVAHSHRMPHMRTITVTWTIDGRNGLMVDGNDPFCWVMRLSHEEVRGFPATPLLRPHGNPRDPEILAIVAGMQRLKRGETVREDIRDTWIQAKDDTIIRIPHATMTYNVLNDTFSVMAEISIEYLNELPQLKTPWDSIPWLQHQVRDLALKLDNNLDLMQRRITAIRTEQELALDDISTLKPKRMRKERSDKGTTHLKPADFEKALRAILAPGVISTADVRKQVRHRCGPGGSAAAFSKYLEPFRQPGVKETPTQIVTRLGQTWYPATWLKLI